MRSHNQFRFKSVAYTSAPAGVPHSEKCTVVDAEKRSYGRLDVSE